VCEEGESKEHSRSFAVAPHQLNVHRLELPLEKHRIHGIVLGEQHASPAQNVCVGVFALALRKHPRQRHWRGRSVGRMGRGQIT
jgi:hypothetical protein